MSLIKWLVISTLITLPFMFILPADESIDLGGDKYSELLLMQLHFNDVCSNAILADCPDSVIESEYSECMKIYGNLTMEQCKEKCCDPTRIEQEGAWPQLP